MDAFVLLLVVAVKSIDGSTSEVQEPVNRVMTVWSGPDNPTPDISCVVGFLSIEITQLWRINCSEASNYKVNINKELRKRLKWPKEKREIVFGSQPDNTPWPGEVISWVCATFPQSGTVTFDCVPENMAPQWFKTAIQGPAYGQHLRRPGCNGGVCYCNHRNYCNDRNKSSRLHGYWMNLVITQCLIWFKFAF